MINFLYKVTNWTEIGGILIALVFVIFYKPKSNELRFLVMYVFIAFILNLFSTAIVEFHNIVTWLPKSNSFFYNLHSLAKVFLFGLYLHQFVVLKSSKLILVLTIGFTVFFILNFIFFEPISEFSYRISILEAIVILLICNAFFIATITDNSNIIWMNEPSFVISAGLNFYQSINFFIFLFFKYFNTDNFLNNNYFKVLMIIFPFSYFILCIIIVITLRRTMSLKREPLQNPFIKSSQ